MAPPTDDEISVKTKGLLSGNAIPYKPGSVTPNTEDINAGGLSVFVFSFFVFIQTARSAPAKANECAKFNTKMGSIPATAKLLIPIGTIPQCSPNMKNKNHSPPNSAPALTGLNTLNHTAT